MVPASWHLVVRQESGYLVVEKMAPASVQEPVSAVVQAMPQDNFGLSPWFALVMVSHYSNGKLLN